MNLSSIIMPKGECKYRPSIMCYPINIEVKHQTFYKQKSAVIIDMYKFHIKIVVDLRPQISMLVEEKGSSNNRFLSILYTSITNTNGTCHPLISICFIYQYLK